MEGFRADRSRSLLRGEFERFSGRLRGHQAGWTWALRDVTFRAEPGDSIGIVGVNRSGKTTLLKMLTGAMYRYAGRIDLSGRLGPLINITAGLHPDLTGHENVYIAGSLFGLPRKEVARRFDEIVAFAELEHAMQRQVKFYSSGMQLRLGFSVAALMDPDVLLVDEVLATGDAVFQQKCLERTRGLIASGTTLVFVSHDLPSVEGMCRRGIWLRDGVIQVRGGVRERPRSVSQLGRGVRVGDPHRARRNGVAHVIEAEVTGPEGNGCRTDESLEIRVVVESPERREAAMHLGVSEGPGTPIFVLRHDLCLADGETEARCCIRHLPLPRGRFRLWMAIFGKDGQEPLLPWQPAANFDVSGPDLDPAPQGVVRLAPVQLRATWDVDGRR